MIVPYESLNFDINRLIKDNYLVGGVALGIAGAVVLNNTGVGHHVAKVPISPHAAISGISPISGIILPPVTTIPQPTIPTLTTSVPTSTNIKSQPLIVPTQPVTLPPTVKSPGQPVTLSPSQSVALPPITVPQTPPTSARPPKILDNTNTHVQQAQAGGPAAAALPPAPPVQPRQTPPPPPIVHPPPTTPVPVAERPCCFEDRFPVCTFQRFPDRFREFDIVFFERRRKFRCFDFREEFDDDDHRRFHVFIEFFRPFRTINIVLVEHILGLIFDPFSADQGQDVPNGFGIWVIGVDGQWYRVNQAELNLIMQIESQRGVDNHAPITIGGPQITLHAATPDTPAPSAGIDNNTLLIAGGGLAVLLLLMSMHK